MFQQILYENFGIAYRFLFYALTACAGLLLVNTYLLFPTISGVADKPGGDPEQCDEEGMPLKTKDTEKEGKAACDRDAELPVWKHVVSGGVIWSIVLMGVCRLRLWFFMASFHHFIGSLPGASESTGICGQSPKWAVRTPLSDSDSLFASFIFECNCWDDWKL